MDDGSYKYTDGNWRVELIDASTDDEQAYQVQVHDGDRWLGFLGFERLSMAAVCFEMVQATYKAGKAAGMAAE
jgi:hypothetical protein